MGAPLNDESLPKALKIKVDEVGLLVSRLPSLHAHIALYLLKNCLAISKLIYRLRCCPSWKAPDQLADFDRVVRQGLELIINSTIEDDTWFQASLPVGRVGIGTRSAPDLSVPAFLASFLSTTELVNNLPGITTLDPAWSDGLLKWLETSGTDVIPTSKYQRDWEAPILEKKSNILLASAITPKAEARIRAVTRKEYGDFLNAIPFASIGTLMNNETFRIAVGLRLGIMSPPSMSLRY